MTIPATEQDVENSFRVEIAARLETMRRTPDPKQTWPEGCYGSALSWLLFVGPSPGGKQHLRPKRTKRDMFGGLCLWDTAFDLPYSDAPDAWGGKYRENIPVLVETIIGLPLNEGSAKLYGFVNFDWMPNSREQCVSKARLRAGEVDVLMLLKQTKPRIIAPTTTQAYMRVVKCLRREGYKLITPENQIVRIRVDPLGRSFHTSMDIGKIQGNGSLKGSIIIRMPQHPARMLYKQHGHRCSRAMRSALMQVHSGAGTLVIEEE